jgi:indole-3-glycerol phosphate synthase
LNLKPSNPQTAEPEENNGRPSGVLAAGGILDRIVETKAKQVRAIKRGAEFSVNDSAPTNVKSGHSHPFAEALSRPDKINIVAEIKHRSPSKGVIREDFDPVAIAASYVAAGAAALSVLTEEDFFGGSLTFLASIRNRQPDIPLLRKDFIFDEVQLAESKHAGADAVLLITAILDDYLLRRLIDRAAGLGLDALVEVHTRSEMERAIGAGARIIGVNNRDLTDFSVSLDVSTELAVLAPLEITLVSESGIATGHDISRLKTSGFNAFLIGEHFMRAPDPGLALQSLVHEADASQAPVGAGKTVRTDHSKD